MAANLAATSVPAIGWISAGGTRMLSPSAQESAMPPANSKNWVARRMVYGTPEAAIPLSCATLARMYPLSGMLSAPTTDSATW